MRLSLRLRLFVMALLSAALTVTIVGAAAVTWRQVRALRRHFSGARIDSFRMADHLQAGVLNLNATLLRFVLGRNPSDRQAFSRQADRLRAWLGQQRASTPREGQALAQVRSELGIYRAEASTIASSPRPGPVDTVAVLSRIESASQTLLNLGYRLAGAHRVASARLVKAAQQSLTGLQAIIFGALLLLVLLGAGGFHLVYREAIAPLRLKLVESRAVIERQEKLASLGVLAAGLAHEIRNPLTAIKARLFTLRKAVGEQAPAAADAQLIEREISRLERLVRDVLLFARPAEPRFEALSALGLLGAVRDLMAEPLEKSGIGLTVKPLADVTLEGDFQQLKQVLLNLVRNAAESIGERGTITLSAAVKPVSFGGHPTPMAVVEVEDNGQGIPVEEQKRLFDPFYTTKPAGTGLGLSIAARIVDRHGGALRYQTEVGRGTRFGVLLPARTTFRAPSPPPQDAPHPPGER
jgi:signal transduction histidine kinase